MSDSPKKQRRKWSEMTPRERRSAKLMLGAVIAVLLLCCCCCGCGPVSSFVSSMAANANINDVTVTVCDVHDQTTGNGKSISHKYMVFARKKGETSISTYVMEDGLLMSGLRYRTDTSDEWGRLSKGSIYQGKTTGWRLSWASAYPNFFPQKKIGEDPVACPSH